MNPAGARLIRGRFRVEGFVQGVGFRPFVHDAARRWNISGWIRNFPGGVLVDAQGLADDMERFADVLEHRTPPAARVDNIRVRYIRAGKRTDFRIRESLRRGTGLPAIPADRAPCAKCLSEMSNPGDRRYQYPFINCVDCGPRYSIMTALPFDRANTTMADFAMCDECRAEYEDPDNRRFHAQTIACPHCGPRPEFRSSRGDAHCTGPEALDACVRALERGQIIALKGVGAYQLLADPFNDDAVRELRERKHRPAKPFALACANLEQAQSLCEITPEEAELLRSPMAPIVLLPRRESRISPLAAPDNSRLGVMLPASPLHALLLERTGPLIMTSGNLSGEPPCATDEEAFEKLGKIAHGFLSHNRRIHNRLDDSVLRWAAGRPMIMRRARGYSPLRIAAPESERAMLATGAHKKNAVALAGCNGAFLGPHIGDLDTQAAVLAHRRESENLAALLRIKPEYILHDLHSAYASTREAMTLARAKSIPTRAVQHHYAHALAIAADNELQGPFLAIAWDGTGLGADGRLWGGEFLEIDESGFRPFARLRPFPLPGGETAIRDIRRIAAGALHVVLGRELFSERPIMEKFDENERRLLERMLDADINCPRASSAGRLFDATAAIIGLRARARFEGEAAIALEQAADAHGDAPIPAPYPFSLKSTSEILDEFDEDGAKLLDWGPMLTAIERDACKGVPPEQIALRFHDTLAHLIGDVALESGHENVVLCGGCFQNRVLLELAIEALRKRGPRPFWSREIPPGDGGIAAGQLMAAAGGK